MTFINANKLYKTYALIFLSMLFSFSVKASFLLIPMDDFTQTNHLKAYGITYWSLQQGHTAKWLLNYEGEIIGFGYGQSCKFV